MERKVRRRNNPRDYVPLSDAHTERSVIAVCLMDPQAAHIAAATVRPEMFYFPVHADIFGHIRELVLAGRVVTEETVAFKFPAQRDELGKWQLQTSRGAVGVEEYCSQLIHVWKCRQTQERAAKELQAATNGELLGDLPSDATGSLRSLRDYLEDRELVAPLVRMATGFPDLDKALNGGFVPGGLYVLAGATGHGKTTIALNMLRRIGLNGVPALFLTLEIPWVQAVRAILAASAHVCLTSLETVQCSEEELEALRSARSTLADLPIHLDDATAALDAVVLLIRTSAQNGKRVVFLDQTSWLCAKGETSLERVTEISRRLKTVAREARVVLVLLAQVNREGCKNPAGPTLYDLRDSGTLEQDADGVIMIRNLETFVDGRPAVLQAAVLKHRHGPQGEAVKASFSWFQAQARIESYAPYSATEASR